MCRIDWKTPIECFLGKKPDISYFRVFGCLTYVHIPKDQHKDKLTPKAEEMIFLGYEKNSKVYRFLCSNRSIYVATTATFVENLFPNCPKGKLRNKISIPEPRPRSPIVNDIGDDDTSNHPFDNLDIPPIDPPLDQGDGPDKGGGDSPPKPETPTQRRPAPTVEEVPDEESQIPPAVTGRNPSWFNIGRPPTPPRHQPFVPLRQQPPVSLPRHNPPQVCNPPARPDNIYGTGHFVDIE